MTYTHTIFRCPRCKTEVWVPRELHGNQRRHEERHFCGCDEQGIRMEPVNGPDGRVTL